MCAHARRSPPRRPQPRARVDVKRQRRRDWRGLSRRRRCCSLLLLLASLPPPLPRPRRRRRRRTAARPRTRWRPRACRAVTRPTDRLHTPTNSSRSDDEHRRRVGASRLFALVAVVVFAAVCVLRAAAAFVRSTASAVDWMAAWMCDDGRRWAAGRPFAAGRSSLLPPAHSRLAVVVHPSGRPTGRVPKTRPQLTSSPSTRRRHTLACSVASCRRSIRHARLAARRLVTRRPRIASFHVCMACAHNKQRAAARRPHLDVTSNKPETQKRRASSDNFGFC